MRSPLYTFFVAIIVLVATLAVVVVGGLLFLVEIKDQAKTNQHHTDCAITFALANDPVTCNDVKLALERDGIPLSPAPNDPKNNPAVAVILCNQNAIAKLPPPEGVTCP